MIAKMINWVHDPIYLADSDNGGWVHSLYLYFKISLFVSQQRTERQEKKREKIKIVTKHRKGKILFTYLICLMPLLFECS